MFEETEQWGARALETTIALQWLWEATTNDHEAVPHVKMDVPCEHHRGKLETVENTAFDWEEEGEMITMRAIKQGCFRSPEREPGN